MSENDAPRQPGWYVDQQDSSLFRFFDGTKWSTYTKDVSSTNSAPPQQSPGFSVARPPQSRIAPAGEGTLSPSSNSESSPDTMFRDRVLVSADISDRSVRPNQVSASTRMFVIFGTVVAASVAYLFV